jgi:hypothetical protein
VGHPVHGMESLNVISDFMFYICKYVVEICVVYRVRHGSFLALAGDVQLNYDTGCLSCVH